MRSSRPLLARSNMAALATATPPPYNTNIDSQAGSQIPSIRLISATPSATGTSESGTSFNRSLEASWENMVSQQSIIAPKTEVGDQPRKKLVPKKSKLSILGMVGGGRERDKDKDRGKDLSDVVRRIGASPASTRGFEIYVDPTVDPDIGEIVMVKKQKSRVALNGMSWGTLEEVTNVPKVMKEEVSQAQPPAIAKGKENPALLKVKAEEERKWWSIGRGRKDSKEKAKERENKMSINSKAVEYNSQPAERCKIPDTLKSFQESPGRFNSVDSGILLGNPKSDASSRSNNLLTRSQTPTLPSSESESTIPERARSATPSAGLFFRSATPTTGGLLAPPDHKLVEEKGSIALRAIRSMRSLAGIGSWSQLKSSSSSKSTTQELVEEIRKEGGGERREEKAKEKDGTVKEKKRKGKKEDGEKIKIKKKKERVEEEVGTVKKKSVKKDKGDNKEKQKDKATMMRISTSSFEVGHLSASPVAPKTLGTKKHSILGLGLPSTMRLPRMRGGSTASSLSLMGQANPSAISVNPNNVPSESNRLSVENIAGGRDRSPSVTSSNGSSLRPVSVASSISRLSTGSSVVSGTSVRWDEDGLEAVRERRKKERNERRLSEDSTGAADKAERRTSRESRRSSGGQRRTPLSSIFPDVQHHHIGTAMLQGVTEEDSRIPVIDCSVGGNGSESDGLSMMSMSTTSSSVVMRRRSYGTYPILTIEEATADGHGDLEADEMGSTKKLVDVGSLPSATPVKRRIRPLSEQLLGRARPKAIHEDEDGVHSILARATDDLALLLDTLHLEASPGTPDVSPLKDSNRKKVTASKGSLTKPESESPLKRTLRTRVSSIRPYAQSRGHSKRSTPSNVASGISSLTDPLRLQSQTNASLIGQQIAPWPVLIASVSPAKDKPKDSASIQKVTPPSLTFKPGHKRTMTPAPEPEPEPVLQPLKPARSKAIPFFGGAQATIRASNSNNVLGIVPDVGSPSSPSCTDGVRSRRGSMTLDELSLSAGSLTPVFKRIQDVEENRRRTSLCPADYRGKRPHVHLSNTSQDLGDSYSESFSVPIARDVRKALGMSGTLGGSDISRYDGPAPDASDPDSDVPEELRFILAGHSNREPIAESLSFKEEHGRPVLPPAAMALNASFLSSLSVLPPAEPLLPLDRPVFRAALIDEDQNHFEIDGGAQSSDEDTKKSFDFTGELEKLNESGASDRASFVEQLEIAFKTPAKIDLRCDFGTHLQVQPPVPPLPPSLDDEVDSANYATSSDFDIPSQSHSQLLGINQPSALQDRILPQSIKPEFDDFPISRLAEIKESSLLDDFTTNEPDHIDVDSKEALSMELARSTDSRPSNGELDRSFRFGGLPKDSSSSMDESKPLTLSDIIPPPDCARAIAEGSLLLDDLEDDSVLNSIYAKLMGKGDNGDFPALNTDLNEIKFDGVASRPVSGISFAGLESFDEVRRGFEFSGDRSFYPPPARTARRPPHLREESVFSIASVSSYGRVITNGVSDPFDYGLPSLQERPSSEDMSSISISMTVEDTFAFIRNQPRQRLESDASSFYFRDATAARSHGRRDSNLSIISQAPPISLYNRSFGHHRRNESTASSSSVAISYAKYGANNGISAWARHRGDISIDSVSSDFSGMHLGRPGIGDKMFDRAVDLGPLTSISASPPDKVEISDSRSDHRTSFDSILDDEQRSSIEDSLFEKTGHRSSISSDSVFGEDNSHPYQSALLPPNQFRPLSVVSLNSLHSPMEEGDTMISMLGGGHVRRRSISSAMDASPCARIEKRKHSGFRKKTGSPKKAFIVERPSISSTASIQFGGERMIKARQGLLERKSLEEGCFVADGEEISGYCMPVFTRPLPARSRSSTCTSSSGADTPPLSTSDGSMSEGSQSSMDLGQLNIALANATHPLRNAARRRIRARGSGHRRHYSKAAMSQSSVYETIEEEAVSPSKSISPKDDATSRQPIFVVDSDTASMHSKLEESIWDDERGIVTLRKFYALRDEAENTVSESKRVWLDTPFSIFAVQSFQPPQRPAGMRALLEHSVQSFGPLPSEFRPRRIRSRTSSRPSPYPQNRTSKPTLSVDHLKVKESQVETKESSTTPVLRSLPLSSNKPSVAPTLQAFKHFSPLVVNTGDFKAESKYEKVSTLPSQIRPRVGSVARRTALGWSKRSGKSSSEQKENAFGKENVGMIMTPGDTLRLNRPRPKGRTPGGRTPASQNRLVRI